MPHLKKLREQPNATPRQKIISEIFSGVERTRIDTERNLLDVLDTEGKDAQPRFAYKTGTTQVLFLQHVIDSLKPGGRCGIVLDEGLLFRSNGTAFVQAKRKLLDACDLWCVLSLPPGTFVNAGAGAKTDCCPSGPTANAVGQ